MNEINALLADCPGLGRVRLCECNSVHLTLGPVTLDLALEAFAQTAILIQNAMEQLTQIINAKKASSASLQSLDPKHSQLTH